jgi:hypothetical protein
MQLLIIPVLNYPNTIIYLQHHDEDQSFLHDMMFCIYSIKDKDVFIASIVQSISFVPETISNVRY